MIAFSTWLGRKTSTRRGAKAAFELQQFRQQDLQLGALLFVELWAIRRHRRGFIVLRMGAREIGHDGAGVGCFIRPHFGGVVGQRPRGVADIHRFAAADFGDMTKAALAQNFLHALDGETVGIEQ